jgi:hypothetical protein
MMPCEESVIREEEMRKSGGKARYYLQQSVPRFPAKHQKRESNLESILDQIFEFSRVIALAGF